MRFLMLLLIGLLPAHADTRYRFLIPEDVLIKEVEPASKEAFALAAEQPDTFGMKIELLVQRGAEPFKTVPLSTPVCNGDYVAFQLTPSETGYATILNRYPEDGAVKTKLIHPQPCDEYGCMPCAGNQRFSPSAPIRFPRSRREGYPIKNDAGDDGLLFFVSNRPFSRQARGMMGELMACPPSDSELPSVIARDRAIDHMSVFRELGPAEEAYVVAKQEALIGVVLNHVSCDDLP